MAINEILHKTGARRLGLVSPYSDEVQAAIIDNYQNAGYEIVAEQHSGLEDNYSFSEVTSSQLDSMIRGVAAAKPEAILIMCTNLRGAPLVHRLEEELGIPIYDSVATVVWKAMQLTGIDSRRLKGWGSLFREVV